MERERNEPNDWVKSVDGGYTIMDDDGKETLRGLVSAVSRAAGRGIEFGPVEVNTLACTGCYILNRWGYGPMYDYGMYIGGPVSERLVEDLMGLGPVDGRTEPTHVPDGAVSDLRDILGRGPGYTEAYALILVATDVDPRTAIDRVGSAMTRFKPELKDEIAEVLEVLGYRL